MSIGEVRIARGHQHLRNAWTKRRLAAQMWIVCFYIGPGLSEIRHQTPDGQEARKPVKKDRSTLPIISNPCCLQAKEYRTKVH